MTSFPPAVIGLSGQPVKQQVNTVLVLTGGSTVVVPVVSLFGFWWMLLLLFHLDAKVMAAFAAYDPIKFLDPKRSFQPVNALIVYLFWTLGVVTGVKTPGRSLATSDLASRHFLFMSCTSLIFLFWNDEIRRPPEHSVLAISAKIFFVFLRSDWLKNLFRFSPIMDHEQKFSIRVQNEDPYWKKEKTKQNKYGTIYI